MKLIIFNILADSYSLNILTLLLPQSAQEVKITTNVLPQMYENLNFMNFVFFGHLLQ